MEIPKNTTQIGEIQGNQKIFIEDYVISYIKQLCRQEPDCKKRIAFYGVMRTEQEQEYFFTYGACRITMHGKNDYYLTAQDYEEITAAGEKYFAEYASIGYVTIEDELPEGIFLLYGGKEKYIKGYHIFYEKNDSMLTFLIDIQNKKNEENEKKENSRVDNVSPIEESIKSEQVPIRSREEMLHKSKNDSQAEIKLFGIVKSVAASLLIVLCVTAISTMNGFGKIEGVQNYFQKAFREIKEKKIPDKEEIVSTSAEVDGKDVTVVTNKENDIIITETAAEVTSVSDNMTEMIKENQAVNTVSETVNEPTVELAVEPIVEPVNEPTEEIVETEPRSHVIEAGDTLISISRTFYGDDSKVSAICELNGITNSDNIQVGQKIILP